MDGVGRMRRAMMTNYEGYTHHGRENLELSLLFRSCAIGQYTKHREWLDMTWRGHTVISVGKKSP